MTHEEISTLNLIVNMYLDYAELQAKGHNPMHMADWESKLGDFLRFNGREVLDNFGTVKREVAENWRWSNMSSTMPTAGCWKRRTMWTS